jgi:hypothetical protein
MELTGDLKFILSLGAAAITLLGAWYAVKYGLKEAMDKIEALQEQNNKQRGTDHVQFQRLDHLATQVTTLEVTVEHLRRDLDRYLNGRKKK